MAAKKKKNQAVETNPYRDEIILVVTLVISVLLALSTFNLAGFFGKLINYPFFGLFGFLAYLLPYALFFGVAFGVSNQGSHAARVKLASSAGLVLVLAALLQLIFGGYSKEQKLLDIYKICAEGKKNGGLVGAAIAKTLCSLFGVAGTYAILIGLAVVLVMLVTEKLLFASLKKKRLQAREEWKKREQEQEFEEDFEEEEPPKRKAKVFTFEKEPKREKKEKIEETEKIEPKPKKKARKQPGGARAEKSFEKPAFLREASVGATAMEMGEALPIYEEELKNKFHREVKEDTMGELIIFRAKEDEMEDEMKAENAGETGEIQEEAVPEPEVAALEPVIPESVVPESVMPEPVAQELDEQELVVPEPVESEPAISEPVMPEPVASELDEPEPVEQKPVVQEPIEPEPAMPKSDIPQPDVPKLDIPKPEVQQKEAAPEVKKPVYVFPDLSLLSRPKGKTQGVSDEELKATAALLQSTLESFGVRVEMKNVSCGPSVTRYELQPAQGVKVSKITGLTDDLKLALAAADIRIEAPIPGKAAVGIEVPNKENTMVMLRSLLESQEFQKHPSTIAFAVGKDIGGNTIVADIAKMPHLLIAGATGSGKSVCINTLIMSILYKASPEDVRLIMVDPKVVELSVYNGIPHLMIPVVTEPKKASAALNWAVAEMTERYKKFADLGVRNMEGYNKKVAAAAEENDPNFQKMPQIVIIVDELADLMMVAPGEVEDAICRLAQLARAAGIHLIIATQRPSVNVITGLIKANVPSRIAFAVSSVVDSRTILDGGGAEKLLGKGDMLFFPSGYPKPVRIQGAFVSDKEVSDVVEFLKENSAATYDEEIDSKIAAAQTEGGAAGGADRDEYFMEAGKFIIEKDKASIGMLQRVYKIGFNRAARIMDQLSEAGVVGPEEGTKPRKVLMSMEEFEQYIEEYV